MLEVDEISGIAGRTMVTGIGIDLRITAIVDHRPEFEVGDKIHFNLSEQPSCWFNETGKRIS